MFPYVTLQGCMEKDMIIDLCEMIEKQGREL